MADVFTPVEAREIRITKSFLVNYINNNNALRNPLDKGLSDVVIAGGFFASNLRTEEYNDIDVFILNNNVNKFSYLIHTNEPDPSGSVWSVRSDAGVYLKNPHIKATALNKDTKVQYILTDFTSRKELLSDFDFVHCTTSYVPEEDKLYITREAYDCIMKKELRHNKPGRIPAEWRREKFEKRGWMYQVHVDDIIQSKSRIQTILDEVLMDDILKRHGNQDAVLAYQNR